MLTDSDYGSTFHGLHSITGTTLLISDTESGKKHFNAVTSSSMK